MLEYSTCHAVSVISSLIIGTLAYVLDGLIFNKYKMNRNKIRLSVFLMTFCLATAIIVDPLIFLYSRFAASTLAEADIIIIKQSAISFSLVGIGNLFLAYFIHEVFFEKKPKTMMYLFIGLELFVASILPIITFLGQDFFIPLAAQVLMTFLISLTQFIYSIRLQTILIKNHENTANVQAIRSIGLSGLFLVLSMISFIMQELAADMGVADYLGCSYFIMLGWAFGGLSTLMMYFGYFMPEWLKKRYEPH